MLGRVEALGSAGAFRIDTQNRVSQAVAALFAQATPRVLPRVVGNDSQAPALADDYGPGDNALATEECRERV